MANIQDLFRQNYGQLGSVFCDTADTPIKPPTNKVFIAITFIADTKLEILGTNAGGLTADTSNPAIEFVGTDVAAHNLGAGNETLTEGSGGAIIDNGNTFPAGVTIYGRWTSIEIANGQTGAFIAYIGR